MCTLLGEKLVAEAQCLLEPRYMKTLLVRKDDDLKAASFTCLVSES